MDSTEKPDITGVEGFSERLKIIVGNESVRSFCRRLGMSDRGFRAYLDGKSYPSLEKLVAIADLGGVNLEWLATGKGGQYKEATTGSKPAPGMSSQTDKIMEMINQLSEENRREILHRIESLHEADCHRKRLEALVNEIEELKNKLA